jgi:hypothetical protein
MGIVDGATVTVDLTQENSHLPVTVLILLVIIGLATCYLFSRKHRKK